VDANGSHDERHARGRPSRVVLIPRRRKYPPDAPRIECQRGKTTRFDLAQDQPRDQESGNDKEDVDADIAARNQPGPAAMFSPRRVKASGSSTNQPISQLAANTTISAERVGCRGSPSASWRSAALASPPALPLFLRAFADHRERSPIGRE
jgi:hypothetical protein